MQPGAGEGAVLCPRPMLSGRAPVSDREASTGFTVLPQLGTVPGHTCLLETRQRWHPLPKVVCSSDHRGAAPSMSPLAQVQARLAWFQCCFPWASWIPLKAVTQAPLALAFISHLGRITWKHHSCQGLEIFLASLHLSMCPYAAPGTMALILRAASGCFSMPILIIVKGV